MKRTITLAVAILVLGVASSAAAQSAAAPAQLGVGTNLNVTGSSQGLRLGLEEIHLVYNAGRIRFAPFVGLTQAASSREENEAEVKNLLLTAGAGIFLWTQPSEDIGVYLGPTYRLGLMTIMNDDETTEDTIEMVRHDIGALLGVEYWLAPNLTLGAELGVEYGLSSLTDKTVNKSEVVIPPMVESETDQTQISTTGAFTLRWYLM